MSRIEKIFRRIALCEIAFFILWMGILAALHATKPRQILFLLFIWIGNLPIWLTCLFLISGNHEPQKRRRFLILMAVQAVVTFCGIELGLMFEGENFGSQLPEPMAILAISYGVVQVLFWTLYFPWGIWLKMTVRGLLQTTAYLCVYLATIAVPLTWLARWDASR